MTNPNWQPPRIKTAGKIAILIWLGVPTLIIWGIIAVTSASPDKVPAWVPGGPPVAAHR